MTKPQTDLPEQIKQATDGLMYTSESDYPLEPFRMEGDGKESIRGCSKSCLLTL
jgi:hypothetical protein